MTSDITISGKPYMLEGEGISLRTSALPAALSTGGGEQYADSSSWSAIVLDELNLGVGHEQAGGGKMRASTLDTSRLADTVLPQKVIDKPYAGTDEVHFTIYDGTVYAVRGLDVSGLVAGAWVNVATLPPGPPATDVEAFDQYLHIGRGGLQVYDAVHIPTASVVPGPHAAEIIETFGGFIYTATGTELFYSNGGHSDCGAVTPPPTVPYDPLNPTVPGWEWTPVALGPCDNTEGITGLQGMYLGSLTGSRMFISTTRQLYSLLPGDLAVGSLLQWPTVGVGMEAWGNELYIPVGDGLTRWATNGSTFAVGLDQNYGLPESERGPITHLVGTPRGLMASIKNTVYAYDGEGWRFIARVPTDITGLDYDPFSSNLLVAHDANVSCVRLNPYLSADSGPYTLTGEIDYGDDYGGLRLLQKDYHEIIVNGVFPTGTQAEIFYSVDDGPRTSIGVATQDAQVLAFACFGTDRPVGRKIRIWAALTSPDESVTPTLQAVVVRYLPNVVDTSRWTYAILLPKDCILDACGNPIAGYNQSEWECVLKNAISGVRPVEFVDFDGGQYSVKVVDWSIRIKNREFTGNTVTYDKVYTLSLLQTCGNPWAC